MKLKAKIIASFGALSTLIGGGGTAITAFGLCPCVLAPALSWMGITIAGMSFLADNNKYFLIAGVGFLLLGALFYSKDKVCIVKLK